MAIGTQQSAKEVINESNPSSWDEHIEEDIEKTDVSGVFSLADNNATTS